MAEKKTNSFMTPVFRVSFPAVFKARAAVQGAEPKFSIGMLFSKNITDPHEKAKLEALKTAVNAAATAKWGPDQTKWPKGLKSPWHDGTEKDYEGYGPDIFYASASSKMKPGLVDSSMNPIIAENEFAGGDYARATVTIYAYDNVLKGVGIGLRNIQKVRDGERFSGASKAEDDFDAIPQPAGAVGGLAPTTASAAPAGAGAPAGFGFP